jgi:hypothetical protein
LREGHGKRSKGKINVCRHDRFRNAGVNRADPVRGSRIAASGSCRAALDLGYTAGDTDAAGSLTTSDAVTDEKTLDARVEALVRCANRLI